MKRILAVVLAVVMLLPIFSVNVFAGATDKNILLEIGNVFGALVQAETEVTTSGEYTLTAALPADQNLDFAADTSFIGIKTSGGQGDQATGLPNGTTVTVTSIKVDDGTTDCTLIAEKATATVASGLFNADKGLILWFPMWQTKALDAHPDTFNEVTVTLQVELGEVTEPVDPPTPATPMIAEDIVLSCAYKQVENGVFTQWHGDFLSGDAFQEFKNAIQKPGAMVTFEYVVQKKGDWGQFLLDNSANSAINWLDMNNADSEVPYVRQLQISGEKLISSIKADSSLDQSTSVVLHAANGEVKINKFEVAYSELKPADANAVVAFYLNECDTTELDPWQNFGWGAAVDFSKFTEMTLDQVKSLIANDKYNLVVTFKGGDSFEQPASTACLNGDYDHSSPAKMVYIGNDMYQATFSFDEMMAKQGLTVADITGIQMQTWRWDSYLRSAMLVPVPVEKVEVETSVPIELGQYGNPNGGGFAANGTIENGVAMPVSGADRFDVKLPFTVAPGEKIKLRMVGECNEPYRFWLADGWGGSTDPVTNSQLGVALGAFDITREFTVKEGGAVAKSIIFGAGNSGGTFDSFKLTKLYVYTKKPIDEVPVYVRPLITDKIALQYAVNIPKGTVCSATFTIPGQEPFTVPGEFNDEINRMVFTCGGILPSQLEAQITTTITGADITIEPNSVKDYCIERLSNSDDQNFKILVSELLRYGKAAQKFANGSDMVLPTNILSETVGSNYANPDTVVTGVTGVWKGATLVLDNTITMRLYYNGETAPTVDAITSTLKPYQKATVVEAGKYIEITGFTPLDYGEVITAEFAGATINYSVGNYIERMAGKGTAITKDIVNALRNYGRAAENYAGVTGQSN